MFQLGDDTGGIDVFTGDTTLIQVSVPRKVYDEIVAPVKLKGTPREYKDVRAGSVRTVILPV